MGECKLGMPSSRVQANAQNKRDEKKSQSIQKIKAKCWTLILNKLFMPKKIGYITYHISISPLQSLSGYNLEQDALEPLGVTSIN